ncbi:phosphoribosyltransferase family protein [Pseudonocardia sp. GCM10023141]|uniref:phosphoribosyltransferase family protein n=1 Tax=Pseudonocardia sp. GCM10023141 TaxID=3252653 RepID=UPI003610BF63
MTAVTAAGSLVERLGVQLHPLPGGADARELLGLALRRNPRRAQLLVSRVLGKHIPTDPLLVRGSGLLLGGLVADVLAGRAPRELPVALLHAAVRGEPGAARALHDGAAPPEVPPPDVLVLGYAETATALGHCVAEGLGGADYLHSTRRPVAGYRSAGGFSEEHSHATEHLLLPADPALLRGGRPLVLVDDELSTGRTVLNTIRALHATAPRERYVVATLVDARGTDTTLVDGVRALGARIDVVALCRAAVELPTDIAERATALRAEIDAHEAGPTLTGATPTEPALVELDWPTGVPTGGRHGFRLADHTALAASLPALAAALADAAGMRPGERTLVLGTEELMALPLRLAQTLADAGHDVRFSTTTRSPAVVAAVPGYALTSGVTFPAHDDPADGPGPRYAYNVAGAWDHVLVVVDPPADTPALRSGLIAALAPHTARTTIVVTPS